MDEYKNQGITKDYPQHATNFWGTNADNNYGFGQSNIGSNIENVMPQNSNTQANPNYISDEDLQAKSWQNVQRFEKVMRHPYLDTKGYITVGGGANVNNYNDFMNVNFMADGVPATETQKTAAYDKLQQMSMERDMFGNYKNRNKFAESFANDTNLRISDEEAYRMAQNHIKNDLSHVRKEFADFDRFPNPLKEVLLDIQYNVKGGLNRKNWPNLYQAIANQDVEGENGIVANIHRKDVGQERNDGAERMARLIRF